MASAGRVCKELGLAKAEQSYLMCELLQSAVYSSNPLPDLEYKKKSASKLDKEFSLQGLKFSEFKECEAPPAYPESFKQTSDRCLRIIDYHNDCVKKEDDGKMTAYIGISHGFAIYQLAHQVGKTGKEHKSWDECNNCFVSI